MIKIATVVDANVLNPDVLSSRMNQSQLEKENCQKQADNTLQTNKWYTSPFCNSNCALSNKFQLYSTSPLHKSNSRVATGLDLKSRYSRKQDSPSGGEIKQVQQIKKEVPHQNFEGFNQLYNNKARFVREIEMQISLLESKSKQPGIRTNDLQPLGQEIYQKLDQYYINYGIAKNFVFYHKPAADQHYKKSQVHQPLPDKNIQSKKLHRPRSLLSGLSNGKQRSGFSRLLGSEQDVQGVNKKIFKNASLHQSLVSSLSERSINDEQMRIVETKMSESELAELDKNYEPVRKMSQDEIMNNHSFIQLKENIRVMEERIAFLIHRLEENKKEILMLKDENNILEGREKEEIGRVKELRKSLQHLNLIHKGCVKQNDSLQRALESMKKEKNEQFQLNRAYERQIAELHDQIQFLKSELVDKLGKISTLEVSLKLKSQEYSELNMAYHGLEQEEEIRRSVLMKRLQESDNQKTLLKDTIKEYKNRLESQGLSFKFEEAHKLKQLFEQSETLHIRQIQKLDESYSKVICSLRDELRVIKNSKILLENALIQWFGVEKVKEMNLEIIEKSKSFQSQTLNLAAVQYDFGAITGEKIGGQFLRLIQSVKALKEEKRMKNEMIEKCEDRIEILKEECQERFEQFQVLSVRVKDQEKVIERLSKQKQQLLQCFNDHINDFKCRHQGSSKDEYRNNNMGNSKLQSKIIEISLSRNSISQNQEITLQCFLKKKAISTPKDIIKFGIKLIEFSEELHQTYNKKLPSLTPHSILISIRNLKEVDISFSKIAKKEEQQGLIYQAPQIILGFSESTLSHCWTIGVIIDELLHKKRFFKSFGQVLSHKDTYVIGDDRFKNMGVLLQMIKKSHKQRISLQKAKEELQQYLKRMGNHHESKHNKIYI